MADLLNIGTSGLNTFQGAISTTGHNIANSTTEGYSRQRVEIATRIPFKTGAGFFGTGSQIVGVSRVYDQFLVDQVRIQTTRSEELNSYYELASRVDNLLSDPEAGLSPVMQEFFDAAQGVADAPGSVPARQVMLSTAESLTQRMQYMYDSMDSLNQAVGTDINNTVTEINTLASAVADINASITLESQEYGQQPNDLLDQRDELLRELAERIEISTVFQDDGAVNVFIGNGQNLVLGPNANQLLVSKDQYDIREVAIELAPPNSSSGLDITQYISGGKLGGIFQFQDEVLEPSLNQLGRVAVGLASTFNAQHSQGLTMNDVLGTDFFTDFMATDAVSVLNSSNNSVAGTTAGAVTATITDVSLLKAKDYRLSYDGTDYTLYSLPDNTSVGSFADTGAPQTITTSEGFDVTITVALSAGDSFEIRPTRSAARDIGVLTDNVSDIAAAGAVRAYDNAANRGDATVTPGELAGTNPVGSFNVIFSDSGGTGPAVNQYEIFDAGTGLSVLGPVGYIPGTDTTITHSDMEFTISGNPLHLDSFRLELNTGAVSDNRNMLELAGLQNAQTLVNGGSGPTVDFQSAYGQLVSMVGTKTHQADVAGSAQETLLNQAVANRESVSGVNMDEEAANLIKFQQGYQATARVITTAQTLFQTLLDSVR